MSSLLHVLMILAGLALLVRGSNDLVEGAASLALRAGLSPLLIGLTVVAMGTSSPELVTGLLGALRAVEGDLGAATVVVGNMVGSNVCNVGLILGLAVAVSPVAVPELVRRRDVPLLLVITFVAAAMAATWGLGLATGLGLTLTFLACSAIILASELRGRHVRHADEETLEEAGMAAKRKSKAWSSFQVLAGLVSLAIGAWLLVDGAVGIALRLGLPEAVIGLTIVAVGTSLPELGASLAAARRGHADIALGNVVGSNAFNLGLGLGLPSLITELPLTPTLVTRDVPVMVGFTLVMALLCMRRSIGRRSGIALMLAYAAYVTWTLVA